MPINPQRPPAMLLEFTATLLNKDGEYAKIVIFETNRLKAEQQAEGWKRIMLLSDFVPRNVTKKIERTKSMNAHG